MPNLAINGGPKAVEKDYPEVFKWPVYGEEEKKAVLDFMDHMIWSEEANQYCVTYEFEKNAAKYFGVKYALPQNSGTSTLHAAYHAVGVGPGDEVITPSIGWVLQVMPIVACHGIPVFADIDAETMCLDPKDIEHRITKRTKAIVLIHLYGHPAEMDEIMEIARAHDLAVIEDASHAHGAEYKGRKVGTIGDIGCFSLQNNKILPSIEGGLFLTNDEEYYNRAVLLGHYERVSKLRSAKYRVLGEGIKGMIGMVGGCLGYKYRMHPLSAAIVNVQLKHLDERLEIMRRNMEYLNKGLLETDVFRPPTEKPYMKRVWPYYMLQYYSDKLNGIPKSLIGKALQAEGVRIYSTGEGYLPLHKTNILSLRDFYGRGCPWQCQHVETEIPNYRELRLPVSETINERLMRLDMMYNKCPREFIDHYINAFHKVIEGKDRLLRMV